ncbi:VOC family protein [Amycolatopsis sp. NPDC003861]
MKALGWCSQHRRGPTALITCWQPLSEEKAVKNRLHLDLAPVEGDQRAEVERLVMLGAKVLDDPPDDPWIVLADPEGNEFCVLPAR